VISTEASVNQKKNWEPFVDAMSKAIGLKVRAFYSQRLCRRHRSNAFQQGADRLVRKQIRDGGGRSLKW
jgi:hypothetical protein